MTTLLLIRHGAHELGGDRIAGRTAGVHLSPLGLTEAAGLHERLAGVEIAAVHASPLERTMETAGALADARGIEVQRCDGLIEIDYGDWTGASLDELRPLDEWQEWNTFRSGRRVPNGESMTEVQGRAVDTIRRLADRYPDDCIALVSHGDVIKSVVAHCVGAPLDLFQRIEISTASVSVVRFTRLGPHVLCVNDVATVAALLASS